MTQGQGDEDKPWAKLRMSRAAYYQAAPWKKAKMKRREFEKLLLLFPDEFIGRIYEDAEAERLVRAIFGEQ